MSAPQARGSSERAAGLKPSLRRLRRELYPAFLKGKRTARGVRSEVDRDELKTSVVRGKTPPCPFPGVGIVMDEGINDIRVEGQALWAVSLLRADVPPGEMESPRAPWGGERSHFPVPCTPGARGEHPKVSPQGGNLKSPSL